MKTSLVCWQESANININRRIIMILIVFHATIIILLMMIRIEETFGLDYRLNIGRTQNNNVGDVFLDWSLCIDNQFKSTQTNKKLLFVV